MAFVLPISVSFVGRRLISGMVGCTSIELEEALKAFIPSMALSFELCGHYKELARTCLLRSWHACNNLLVRTDGLEPSASTDIRWAGDCG
jgi:hypothetical protein